MNNVLTKTLSVQFYKINTGFFVVSFILLFGLLNGKATMELHHHIMQRITGSATFAAGAMIVWLAYNVKCISFVQRELGKPSNSFLFSMQSLKNRKHIWLWISCHTSLLMPVLAYAAVTVAVGFSNGHYELSILFAVFQLLLCSSGIIYFRTINSTWRKPIIVLPEIKLFHKKPFITWLLHYSLGTRKGTFIGVKALSLLLLQAMVAANAYEINKESVCVLMMFLVAAHSLLPVYYVHFMERDLAFVRNLPTSTISKFGVYLFTYAVIFIPELLFLLVNSHHAISLQLTFSLYAVAVSQLLLYTSLQYINKIHTERYTAVVFAFFFASLLFLASFNLWILFAVEAIVSIILFLALYTRYESQTEMG
jgi:hypothetical protein